MSDNQDKTVFRQPGSATPTGEHTIIRPMPGRRGTGQTQVPPASPSYGQAASAQAPSMPGFDVQAAYFRTTTGLNPLVNAASMLIAVYEKTRHSVSHPDVAGLHQRLTNEIKSFDSRAKEQGVRPEVVLAARYSLCALLDEAVLNTPWGAESAWPQKTLLSTFHNETAGGEKFFQILDRMRQSPADNLYILELFYLCLSLGFEGKYRVIHRGKEQLDQLREELFGVIRTYRGEYERSLSPSWQGLGKIRNTLAEYVPMWVVASIVGGFMLLTYSGFRVWLYTSSSPVAEKLSTIAESNTVAGSGRYKSNYLK
ncbi:MAG: type IVB secretion system protein IcmH/DotU [Gammaproteobacteria bacterium]|nr:type IVB secretion system protein IcmH/DotU [Gammaproteobacteria bacterium]